MGADLSQEVQTSAAAVRQETIFNAVYGLAAGVAFALAMWGRDAFALNQAHAFFPWLKLGLGVLMCGFAGAMTSFLASRSQNGLLSVVFWLLGALALGWITVAVPLQITPTLTEALAPQLKGFLDYSAEGEYVVRFWISSVWAGIFMGISGILQTTLVDSAKSGFSLFAKLAPFSVCVILMAISGVLLDDLINAPFRNAIHALDVPIHFILENEGKPIDRDDARKFRTTSLRSVQDEITPFHQLIVSEYDESFGLVKVLIQFEDAMVECTTVYRQPAFCEFAEID